MQLQKSSNCLPKSPARGGKCGQKVAETSILDNPTASPETQLGHLAESLSTLLSTIEAGEWERLAELADRLTPAMDAVQESAAHRKYNIVEHRQKVEAVLAMLESAIHQCSTRKDQLSPLIDALDHTSARSRP